MYGEGEMQNKFNMIGNQNLINADTNLLYRIVKLEEILEIAIWQRKERDLDIDQVTCSRS